MNYIKIYLEPTVRGSLDMPEMMTILGPRQSGKTRLMRPTFGTLENALFISFECRKIPKLFVEYEKTFAGHYVKNNL